MRKIKILASRHINGLTWRKICLNLDIVASKQQRFRDGDYYAADADICVFPSDSLVPRFGFNLGHAGRYGVGDGTNPISRS